MNLLLSVDLKIKTYILLKQRDVGNILCCSGGGTELVKLSIGEAANTGQLSHI